MLRAIDIKVLRDVRRLRAQVVAIALVIACGVGVFVAMGTTMDMLQGARATYYAEQRFGDVFAGLTRAPEGVAQELARIPGVQAVETRVVAPAILDVPRLTEAASARLVSIPDQGSPRVNDIRLTRGRLPRSGHWEEVVASQGFMEAHAFPIGVRLGALVHGVRAKLRVVGVALSPEYTYAAPPGQTFPDDRRFGVFWMRRQGLATALDMEGAFNDVSLSLARGGNPDAVVARTDEILETYGCLGAIPRRDQQSAFFLENELSQLRGFVIVAPPLFLAVAAFLLNVVFGRLIAGQRGDIAALKAFGYRDDEIGWHYAKLIGIVVVAGWALGVLLGWWMGSSMTRLYGKYYRFPALPYRMGLGSPIQSLGISMLSAGIGAWGSVRRTVLLPPAEAMRPESPAVYRPTLAERLGWARLLPTALRIVLREIERKPLRATFSVVGVALATGLTIVMAFSVDSVRYLLNVQLGLCQRAAAEVWLTEPRSAGVLAEIEALPGVLYAEPVRAVPVGLSAGTRTKNISIVGIRPEAALTGLLDFELEEISLPPDGLVLSRKLAELLDVQAGDALEMKVLEGQRSERTLHVARIVETFIGTSAHMQLAPLCRLLQEPETLNGARMLLDSNRLPELHAQVKATPVIAGLSIRNDLLATVQGMLDENLGTMIWISVGFALVMAFGVLYNTARITLAERARELATLRVLGFRRTEVAAILVGDMTLIVSLSIPLGLWVGYGLAAAMVHSPGYDTEQFRLPLVISTTTYATAALTVLAASLVSGWSAWRRLDRFDIVEVLKTRD